MTYEAGQGVVLRTNVELEKQVQRDPRMQDIYTQFLTAWRSRVGDGLTLFALDALINEYGGWGLSEYVGQPLSQTPKRRAVGNSRSAKRSGLGSMGFTHAGCPFVPTMRCWAKSSYRQLGAKGGTHPCTSNNLRNCARVPFRMNKCQASQLSCSTFKQ